MAGEPPRSNRRMKMKLDRISDLPDHIVEQILSYLPILDAVRTSLLSRKWRYRWAMLPNLEFTELSSYLYSKSSMVHDKLVSIIDQVLLLHMGPIHKFQLCESFSLADGAMDRWILHLTRSSIKDISLRTHREPDLCYRVPSCLFSCQSLINLELSYCSLKPPSSFKGFSKLKSLKLIRVSLPRNFLQNFISSCPMLETLELVNIHGRSHLKVDVPSLRFFIFRGTVKGISFENTSFLAEVTLKYFKKNTDNPSRACSNSSNLLHFFVHLPRIQRLDINNRFLKHLAVGVELSELLKPCVHLNYLAVELNLNNWKESLTALCLLKIAPNLQELHIIVHHPIEEETVMGMKTNFWKDDCWNCQTFTKLRVVKITGISITKPELDCIQFLLLNSPVLERMVVKPASKDVELVLLKKLLHLRRASVQARIIC